MQGVLPDIRYFRMEPGKLGFCFSGVAGQRNLDALRDRLFWFQTNYRFCCFQFSAQGAGQPALALGN